MKRNFVKKVIAGALSAAMIITGMTGFAMAEPIVEENEQAAEHTLWLVGDSTVCEFNDDYYYPRYGYGTQISKYIDDTYKVKNLALSGRSSKSFVAEENYITLKSDIKAGDILMIGFGHNDEKVEDSARFTSAYATDTWETPGSFANCLWTNYVEMAQNKGAEVIICTPIIRRNGTGVIADSEQHKPTIEGEVCDYAEHLRKFAAAKNLPLIDLTKETLEYYESIGAGSINVSLDESNKPIYTDEKDGTLFLHAWSSYKPATVDNTHLNIYGASMVAYLFAKAVKEESKSSLSAHVKSDIKAPVKANVLVVNPNYKVKLYQPPTKESELFTDKYSFDCNGTTLEFKPTALGALGGTPSTTNYKMEVVDGKIHMVTSGDKGKLTEYSVKNEKAGVDGFIMYYLQIPSDMCFSLSANAILNENITGDQAAFGLMARDDMYIDERVDDLNTDYVIAGSFGGTKARNCFYKKGDKFGEVVPLEKTTLAKGETYKLSIVKNPDGYTCTFGDEKPQSGGFDFTLNSVDEEYQYIGMFVARTADVTFTDIKFECYHKYDVVDKKNATCKEEGYSNNVCKVCKHAEKQILPIDLNAHSFDEGVITKNPTTESEGEKIYTCKICGTKKTETIAKLEKEEPEKKEETKPSPYVESATVVKGSDSDTLELGKGTDKKGNNIAKLTAKAVSGKATVLVKSKITVTGLDGDVTVVSGADYIKTKYNANKKTLTIQAKKPGVAEIKYPNGSVQTYVIVKPEIEKDVKSQKISMGEVAVVTVLSGQSAEDKDDGLNAYKWTVKGGKSQSVDKTTGEIVVLDKDGAEIARISTSGSTATVKAVGSKAAIKLTAQYLNKKFTATVKVK